MNKLSLSNAFKYQPEITHTASDGKKYRVSVDSLLTNHSFKDVGNDKDSNVYTFLRE